jgi:holo-[acyl-carrier protein] synthase
MLLTERDASTTHMIMMKHSSSCICGIGNDIIAVKRFRRSAIRQGEEFLCRLFTQKERSYCQQFKDPIPHYAGRFAAKEAISKAFGTGLGAEVTWQNIEILNNKQGKPIVHLAEPLQKKFNHPNIILSISHCEEYASAVALWLRVCETM